MSKLFCVSPGLRVLERQMQQPPGYRPRGYGIPYSEIERVDFDDTDIIIEHGDTVLSITLGEDAEDEGAGKDKSQDEAPPADDGEEEGEGE